MAGFREGDLLAVQSKGRVAYLNAVGQDVTPFPIGRAGVFAEGLAPVGSPPETTRRSPRGTWRRWRGRYGYMDRFGELVIPFRYGYALPFSEGLAFVFLKGKTWIIDRTGTLIAQVPTFPPYWFGFHGGVGVVRTMEGVGIIDRVGRWVLKPGGRAGVRVTCLWYSEGLCAASVHDAQRDEDACGFLDRRGDLAVQPIPGSSCDRPFSEGLAVVTSSSSSLNGPPWRRLEGYVNRQGQWEIPPQFLEAGRFSEGVAPVRTEEGWGYIDRDGHEALPFRFAGAKPFSHGLAWVSVRGRWQYIDHDGRTVWPRPRSPLVGKALRVVSLTHKGRGSRRRWLVVFRDAQDYATLCSALRRQCPNGPSDLPAVDFRRFVAVAALHGIAWTGEHDIRVVRAVETDDAVHVTVVVFQSYAGLSTQVIVSPWHLALVPRRDKPYVIHKVVVDYNARDSVAEALCSDGEGDCQGR